MILFREAKKLIITNAMESNKSKETHSTFIQYSLQFFVPGFMKMLNSQRIQVGNMGEVLRHFLTSKRMFLKSQNSFISLTDGSSSKTRSSDPVTRGRRRTLERAFES